MAASRRAAPDGQPNNKDSLLAKVTLISAIIAAAAAIAGPIIVHKLDDSSQAAGLRESAYSNFISQANATESVIETTYTSAIATYKPSQSQEALAFYARLTDTSIGQFRSTEDQLGLVAPDIVIRAAKPLAAAIFALEKDYLDLIQSPDKSSVNQEQQDTRAFIQAMDYFIRYAGGKTVTP
jgi:hypothetical protein